MENLRAQNRHAASPLEPSSAWPDQLATPETHEVQELLDTFWHRLSQFPDLHERTESILLHNLIHELRAIIIRIMLAANGTRYPDHTRHLNLYLGESQRAALEKTLFATGTNLRDILVSQTVALVVIYQWYAPQLVHKYGVQTPNELAADTLAQLHQSVPSWPLSITSD
jgi:hypothetical protein